MSRRAVFLDRECSDDLAGFLGRFHIDHADAAALGQAIAVNHRLLAKALFGNRKDLLISLRRNRAYRHDVITLAKIYASHASRHTTHRANVVFVTFALHSVMRRNKYLTLAVGADNL